MVQLRKVEFSGRNDITMVPQEDGNITRDENPLFLSSNQVAFLCPGTAQPSRGDKMC